MEFVRDLSRFWSRFDLVAVPLLALESCNLSLNAFYYYCTDGQLFEAKITG